jgi:thiol-disulfide isomerase/thioredoxin
VAGFGVPQRLVWLTGTLLPLAVLATAAALLVHPTAQWGGVAAVVLLLGFIAGIANAMSKGQAPDCHCFGQLHSAPAGRGTMIRNVALAVPAAVVAIAGPGPAIDSWVSDRSAAELAAIALGAAAAVLAGYAARLWTERRDLRSEVSRLKAEFRGLPAGLPLGAWAPQFALDDIHGERRTLDELLALGRPVALVFASPSCTGCRSLWPELGRWQAMLGDRITLAVISSGDPAANRAPAEEHGVANVLLQKDDEVMKAYRVEGTPSAIAVTPDRVIASTPVDGPIAIEPHIRLMLRRSSSPPDAHSERAPETVS